MSIILRFVLIVGLVLSPLYSRALANHGSVMAVSLPDGTSEHTMPDTAKADETMPCHDSGKSDCGHCGKGCPCVAACMAMSIQGLPASAVAMVTPAVAQMRRLIISTAQLASLITSPPARPPRA